MCVLCVCFCLKKLESHKRRKDEMSSSTSTKLEEKQQTIFVFKFLPFQPRHLFRSVTPSSQHLCITMTTHLSAVQVLLLLLRHWHNNNKNISRKKPGL